MIKLSQSVKATAGMAVAFMALNTSAVWAMPASPFVRTLQQPDGSVIEVKMVGDETRHTFTTPDGRYEIVRTQSGRYVRGAAFDRVQFDRSSAESRLKAPGKRRIAGAGGFPTHGKQRALAILVEYPETDKHPEGRRFAMPDPRAHFDDMLNKPGYDTDGATGSVHDYFSDASNGVFDLTFDVYGPVTLENDLDFYTAKTNGENLAAWHMVEEGCRAIDDEVDFSAYDRDNDGVIDNVYVFYAGEGGATSDNPDDCIWQHAADIESITGRQFIFDGLRLNHYACSNEYRYVRSVSGQRERQAEGIGTVCHEFSHVLGLPDFYDTLGGGTSTPGVWAVMDTGCHLNDSRTPPCYTAIERMLLGWLDPEVIGTRPADCTLRDISSNEAYRINTPNTNEYFLLENRQIKGWDSYLPGHGLLVWHINYSEAYWNANQVNTLPAYPGIDIVRADGLKGMATLDGDPFPGSARVTALGDDGYPGMMTLDGKRTGAPLSSITEAGGTISFGICKSVERLDKVTGITVSDVTPSSFSAGWPSVHPLAGYMVNVYAGSRQILTDYYVAQPRVTVSGLDAATEYTFTVRAVAGQVRGQESDAVKVTTLEALFDYEKPEGLEAREISDTSFILGWAPLDEATDYDVTVSVAGETEILSEALDFTGGLDNLYGPWQTNCSLTISMAGYFGEAAPALSMADDFARIESYRLDGEVLGLSFWYRERSGQGEGYIEISTSDSDEWTLVDRVSLPARMSEGATYTLDASRIPAGAHRVRIVYRRGSRGSLALDDINVNYAGLTSRIPLEAWNGRPLGSSATETVVDGLDADTAYYVTVRGINADGTRSAYSDELHVRTLSEAGVALPGADTEVTVRVSPDGTVTADGDRTIDAVFDMQGRQVGTRLPSRGVYLVRSGESTAKIIY